MYQSINIININKKDNISGKKFSNKYIRTTRKTLNLHYWHKRMTEYMETRGMILDGKIWYRENIKSP